MNKKQAVRLSAHGLGMAIAGVAVWALKVWGKAETPPEVAVAFGTIAAAVVSLLLPDEKEQE